MLSQCFFIMWQELGRRMGIRDIPPTVQEFKVWSEAYEREHMVPSETGRALAQIALNHISRRFPPLPGLRRLVAALFVCLMDKRLRIAMMCVFSDSILPLFHLFQAPSPAGLGTLHSARYVWYAYFLYTALLPPAPTAARIHCAQGPTQRRRA